MRCAEQFKISTGDGGIPPSTADIGRGVRDQQVESAAKQHIRSYGLFGPLEILKAFCVIAIWIDPTGSQCVHPFRSERSQPVHLFDIVDQCIFDLQLVSAVSIGGAGRLSFGSFPRMWMAPLGQTARQCWHFQQPSHPNRSMG